MYAVGTVRDQLSRQSHFYAIEIGDKTDGLISLSFQMFSWFASSLEAAWALKINLSFNPHACYVMILKVDEKCIHTERIWILQKREITCFGF